MIHSGDSVQPAETEDRFHISCRLSGANHDFNVASFQQHTQHHFKLISGNVTLETLATSHTLAKHAITRRATLKRHAYAH